MNAEEYELYQLQMKMFDAWSIVALLCDTGLMNMSDHT